MSRRHNRIVLAAGITAALITAMAGPGSARALAVGQASTAVPVDVTGDITWTLDTTLADSTDTGMVQDSGTAHISLTDVTDGGAAVGGNSSTYSVSSNRNVDTTTDINGTTTPGGVCDVSQVGSDSGSGSLSYQTSPDIGNNSFLNVGIQPPGGSDVSLTLVAVYPVTDTFTYSGPSPCDNGTSTPPGLQGDSFPLCLPHPTTSNTDTISGTFQGTYPNGTVNLGCSGTFNYPNGDSASFSVNGTLTIAPFSPSADLSLAMAASPGLVKVGSDLTYTITVANNGPSDATGVTVTDALNPGLSFVSATWSAGSSNAVACSDGPPVTCSIGNLAAGDSATISLKAQPTTKGWAAIANTASVAGNEPDPTPGDDTASANTCQYDPTDVTPQSMGPASLTGQATSMLAQFTPQSGLTLQEAVKACPDIVGFDWQQTFTNLPSPSPYFAQNNNGAFDPSVNGPVNLTNANTPFNDPPPGGYTYDYPPGYDASPYYYPEATALAQQKQQGLSLCTVPSNAFVLGIQLQNYLGCIPMASADDKTFSMFDAPRDPCLGGGAQAEINEWCGGISDPKGSFIGFVTSLDAIMQDGTILPIAVWTWTDTFSGFIGGIQLNAAIPLGSSASPAVDPNNGPGGVSITSLNGVPQTPPSVSCTASPSTLWPPNGKSVLVTVSGSITPGTQAIPTGTATFAVTDEYGQVQPTGSITLGAGGSYSFEVPLVAARDGNDQDGRTYSIAVRASDRLGNVGSCTATVTVPHDQGQ